MIARRLALYGMGSNLIAFPGLQKAVYYSSGFHKYGLMRHDLIRPLNPVYTEAIDLLPRDLAAERQYRISRAVQYGSKHQFLPKEEWMTIEKDVPYLTPYLNRVEKEFTEKREYEKKVLTFKSN